MGFGDLTLSQDSEVMGENNLKSAIGEISRQLAESKLPFGDPKREELLEQKRSYERLLKGTQIRIARSMKGGWSSVTGTGNKKMALDPRIIAERHEERATSR